MKTMIKGTMIVAIAALGASLSGCNSGAANANAAATPDPAEQTAASIDQAGTTAPAEAPPAKPAEKPAK